MGSTRQCNGNDDNNNGEWVIKAAATSSQQLSTEIAFLFFEMSDIGLLWRRGGCCAVVVLCVATLSCMLLSFFSFERNPETLARKQPSLYRIEAHRSVPVDGISRFDRNVDIL